MGWSVLCYQSVLRSIEFSPYSERVCKSNRCLGVRAEYLNPIKRNTL